MSAKEKSSPPKTLDILGEHLHCKVSKLILAKSSNGSSKKFFEDEKHLVDKVTGMLMDRRSEVDVRQMLQDDHLLSIFVDQAIDCLEDHWMKEQCGENTEQSDQRLNYEQLGDELYDRVAALDEKFAPEITGMLLELDPRTLMSLLQDGSHLLETAVQKARRALAGTSKPSEPKTSNKSLSKTSEMKQEGKELLEDIDTVGLIVYEMAQKMYPDIAAEITGMILEMDAQKLHQIVQDPTSLSTAIEKACTAWRGAS